MQKSLFPQEDPHAIESLFLSKIPNKEKVVNRRYETEDIYIGRGSLWGNPFKIGEDGNRMEVIEAYRIYLWDRIRQGEISPESLLSLENKHLGCYCSPKPCHGHILLLAIKWARKTLKDTDR